MVATSRLVVALGLVIALCVASIAYASGTTDNTPGVVGEISPKKLSPKKFKPVKLFAGVDTDGPVAGDQGCHPQTGGQCNPEAERIEFGKNLKWKSKAAPFCKASLAGTTTDQAKALCPKRSKLGNGRAAVRFPGDTVINDEVVTAFNGPKKNRIRLHAYSPTLTATNTQLIEGKIVKASSGKKYGKALKVNDAPDAGGDAAMIISFNTTVKKRTGVAMARCKAGKFPVKRTVTYDDGTKESVVTKQNCQRKKK